MKSANKIYVAGRDNIGRIKKKRQTWDLVFSLFLKDKYVISNKMTAKGTRSEMGEGKQKGQGRTK